jgi:hypothetical protein
VRSGSAFTRNATITREVKAQRSKCVLNAAN